MDRAEPIIVAHRGLADRAPENTLAACTAALALGFGIEIDLQRSADGHLVVIHDATVDRTTNGRGAVAEQTLDALRRLDAGSWYGPAFRDQRIPTLEEVLAVVAAHRSLPILAVLELKANDPGIVEPLCAQVAQAGLQEQVVGIGRIHLCGTLRQQIKAVDPRFPTAVLVDSAADWETAIRDEYADWLYMRFIPDREQVVQARAHHKRLLASAPPVVYYHPENWRRVQALGIDALITDHARACRQHLRGASSGDDSTP